MKIITHFGTETVSFLIAYLLCGISVLLHENCQWDYTFLMPLKISGYLWKPLKSLFTEDLCLIVMVYGKNWMPTVYITDIAKRQHAATDLVYCSLWKYMS